MSLTLSTETAHPKPSVVASDNLLTPARVLPSQERRSISWNVSFGTLVTSSSDPSTDGSQPDEKRDSKLRREKAGSAVVGGISKLRRGKRSNDSSNGPSRISKYEKSCKCFGTCCDPSEDTDTDGSQPDEKRDSKLRREKAGSAVVGGISKLRRGKRSNDSSNGLRRISKSEKSCKCFGTCCNPSEDTDTNELYDDFTLKKLRTMEEDEIFSRLQQAVHGLGHGPTNYDIETEILRWHRALEIEQKAYEDSGMPKFKYKWFRKNQYLTVTKLPLYSTDYENHRRLEVRLAEFRFGVSSAVDEELEQDGIPTVKKHRQRKSYDTTNSANWRNNSQIFYANLALLCSASNFLRFPQACYANVTFFLTYLIMVAAVGQPLLYFEMVLGQYSLHGPSGFAKLHPYAKGLPYAVAFVCIVFGTARSVYLAYSMLYAVLSIIASPGKCGFWTEGMKCLAYESFEQHTDLIRQERKNAHNISRINGTSPFELVDIFSVELYFREVMLDSHWITGKDLTSVHWKLIGAYIGVCTLALIPMHYNITGRMLKRYLRWSIILPILVFILFLHQIFVRGAFTLTASYFVAIDTEHVSALSVWSEAFEMVLSTLGIGYGFHWFISGNIAIDYKLTYILSWRICAYAAFFGLMSSLVLFCEIGIVGEFTGDRSHYHVFFERLGISFVCYSGALLKLGGNTFFFILVFFMLFVIYGMWSQIIVADVILRWLEHGYIIKGTSSTIFKRKKSTYIILIGTQLLVLSPYCFSRGGTVLASENIFGGALAAYVVVLAELVIAVYLYGFARFLADLEIMTKTPLPALFQIQIRYIVIPTILVFLLPMMTNVYLFPSIYWERNSQGWLFYFGLMANFTPVLILLIVGQQKNFWFESKSRENKVNPVVALMYSTRQPPIITLLKQQQKSKMAEDIKLRYHMMEPIFVSKMDAPSQQSHSKTIRSEIYNAIENNMKYVHGCQEDVKNQFIKLRNYKINQARWIKLVLQILRKIKVKSFRGLANQIMLAQKYHNDKIDIHFINNLMQQMVNMTFFSAVRNLQLMPTNEMLVFLADELLQLTTFDHNNGVHVLSSSSSDDSSDSSNYTTEESTGSGSVYSFYQEGTGGGDEGVKIHRLLGGFHDKSTEECRTLLIIRLKRGLGLSHDEEMSKLQLLRRERSKRERESSIWSMRDQLPIDHFIPSSITNKENKVVCYTIFHGIVVQGNDHFVLKRLPVPRPTILHVTKSFVNSQPGNSLRDKFSNIITKTMHRNIGRIVNERNMQIDEVRENLDRHFWKLSERVDYDVYDFLDRILTCIVVVSSPEEAHKKTSKKNMYLTPRTRRNRKAKENEVEQLAQIGNLRRKAVFTTQIDPMDIKDKPNITYNQRRSLEQEQIRFLVEREPPDIRYHQNSDDNSEDSSLGIEEDYWINEVKSSSGSSSTLSPEDDGELILGASIAQTRRVSKASIPTVVFGGTDQTEQLAKFKSKYFVVNETLQQRNERHLKKKSAYGILGLEPTTEELNASLNASKIKHISARKWKHERDHRPPSPPLPHTEQGNKEREDIKQLRFTDNEVRLHKKIDLEAVRHATLALHAMSMESLKSESRRIGTRSTLGKVVSIQSLRHLLSSKAEFKVDMKQGEIVAFSKAREDAVRMENKLGNLNPELVYIGFGKMLIVDHGVSTSSNNAFKRRSARRFDLDLITD